MKLDVDLRVVELSLMLSADLASAGFCRYGAYFDYFVRLIEHKFSLAVGIRSRAIISHYRLFCSFCMIMLKAKTITTKLKG